MIDDTPLLVFGGPYSNLQATQAMRREAERHGIPPNNVFCTGDVVAYAAQPQRTIDVIRDWGVAVIAGNCEEQLASGADDCGCGFDEGSECDRLSKGWYPYALQNTNADARRWMAQMPTRLDLTFHGFRIALLHGGATENNKFLFGSQSQLLEAEFESVNLTSPCDIVLAGHAGIPFVRQLGTGMWVNAGVIGMPANDGTPDGWYALLEPQADGLKIALHRLRYDYVAAASDLSRAGHADGYAETLATGIWPSQDILPPDETAATGVPLSETVHVLAPPEIVAVPATV